MKIGTQVRTRTTLPRYEGQDGPLGGTRAHEPIGNVAPGSFGKVTLRMDGWMAQPGEWWEVEVRRDPQGRLHLAYARTEDLEIVHEEAEMGNDHQQSPQSSREQEAHNRWSFDAQTAVRQAEALESIARSLADLSAMAREEMEAARETVRAVEADPEQSLEHIVTSRGEGR